MTYLRPDLVTVDPEILNSRIEAYCVRNRCSFTTFFKRAGLSPATRAAIRCRFRNRPTNRMHVNSVQNLADVLDIDLDELIVQERDVEQTTSTRQNIRRFRVIRR